ncbi:hypothetical protein [Streptomyces sp. NPDC006997]|uniref:hypothetical protein n=1 Tax=Streptomyces sp. NPDC006997 TaxID=3155356 RepID=UPI0033DDD1F0
MVGRIARWGAVAGLGAVWWWAAVRLVVAPDAGVLEGAVAAGGWGLSLLPVHCVAKGRAVGAVEWRRWVAVWRGEKVARGDDVEAGAGAEVRPGAGSDGGARVGAVGGGSAEAGWRRYVR